MKNWLAFLFLGVFAWGSSFYFIKVALVELTPLQTVAWRLTIGLIAIWLIAYMMRVKLPETNRGYIHLIGIGIINTAIPFTLTAWGELHVSSGLAGTVNGLTPLFTMILAAIFISQEQFTLPKALGFVLGFSGLLFLTKEAAFTEAGMNVNQLLGILAIIGTAVSYAIGAVYSKKMLANVHPISLSAISMTSATIFMWLMVVLAGERFIVPQMPNVIFSVAWMGVAGTALAYFAYFYLIQNWGAGRSAMVAYIMPITAIILGIFLLDEQVTWEAIIGTALILIGIYVAIEVKGFAFNLSERS